MSGWLREGMPRFHDLVAVRWGESSLTYRELDLASNRVANAILREDARDASDPVMLLLKKPAEQLTAMLGALKAGRPYVPVDAGQPLSRLAFLLADTGTQLVLTDAIDDERASLQRSGPARWLVLRDVEASHAPPAVDPKPDVLAYVLYTSGSTGEPKGVIQTQGNLLHQARRRASALGLSPADRVSWMAGYQFSASAGEVLGALVAGATICPYLVRAEGVENLASWMIDQRITVYHSVPTVFRRLCAALPERVSFPDLRVIRLGGEPMRRDDVELFRRHFGAPCRLANSLGMTETNSICQHWVDVEGMTADSVVPVGPPLEGIEISILGPEGELLPVGEVGEIAVKSRLLTLGYWRRPEQTAKAFSVDPEDPSQRVFRTGDLGRLRPDGCLEHLGRNDLKIKLRGYGIEPAEVEAELMASGTLKEAAVAAVPDERGELRLVAFVAWSGGNRDVDRLRCELAAKLPDHMLPQEFVSLDALPVLSGGKVDRLALPALVPRRRPVPPASLRQRDRLELQLAGIWEKVFQLAGIGDQESFFALGGDSLRVVQLFEEVRTAFGVTLPPSTLLAAPTIEKLATLLRSRSRPDLWSPLVPLNESGSRPPLFISAGAGGDALSLLDLARALGDDQPVYSFQPPGLDGDQRFRHGVESIAEQFLHHLLKVQPRGPYHLAGHSFGGVVVLQMAQRLRAAGHSVALVAAIDSHIGSYPKRTKARSLTKRLRQLWFRMIGHKAGYNWRDFWTRIKRLRRSALNKAASSLFRGAVRLDRKPRHLHLRAAFRQARERYRPNPYPGLVHLLRCGNRLSPELFEIDPTRGWSGLARAGLVIHDIPGTHNGCLKEPHVRVTAQKLKSCFGGAAGKVPGDSAECQQDEGGDPSVTRSTG